ncbi:MAG: hypothetical protein Q9216_003136 [Gyalolechia sp. 2 TL-2023]
MDNLVPNGTDATDAHQVNINKVLIVGAGCTGLSLAHGLQKVRNSRPDHQTPHLPIALHLVRSGVIDHRL